MIIWQNRFEIWLIIIFYNNSSDVKKEINELEQLLAGTTQVISIFIY